MTASPTLTWMWEGKTDFYEGKIYGTRSTPKFGARLVEG